MKTPLLQGFAFVLLLGGVGLSAQSPQAAPEEKITVAPASADWAGLLAQAKKSWSEGRAVALTLPPGETNLSLDWEIPAGASLTLLSDPATPSVLTQAKLITGDWRSKGDVHSCPWTEAPEVIVADGKFLLKPAHLARPDEEHYFSFLPAQGRVYLKLIPKLRSGSYRIMAVRSGGQPLLRLRGAGSFALKGVTLRQSAGEFALDAEGLASVTLDGARFEWNAARSLRLAKVEKATITKTDFASNRLGGFEISDVKSLTIKDGTSWFNGWFDTAGDFADPLPADTLRRVADATLENFRLSDHHTDGLRLEDSNATLKDCPVGENRRRGLFATGGKLTVTDCQISRNHLPGIVLENAESNLSGNFIVDNSRFRSDSEPRAVEIRVEGGKHAWKGNIVCSRSREEGAVIGVGATPPDFTNSRNLFWQNEKHHAVDAAGAAVPFDAWQVLTRSDLDSMFADPQFAEPGEWNFDLEVTSPWFRQKSWPVRTLP